ncbi:MAG: Adenylate cyclase [uncultured Solirubrobacterales bacterium]|uniref:Adenylate cyclase n=1 Tax=uncultured Solirubrobacterales bacterium TaxID=768556 RepID=A0A6J4SH47_9ACTN|nr:MAG: Adenylate cyclase [uncultured Solirubrobacterales bacterium]
MKPRADSADSASPKGDGAGDEVDFEEEEGLLGGLDGDAREARRALLEDLRAQGVSLEELRRAVAEDRLVLLPLERMLTEGLRLSATEVAALCGLDAEFVASVRQALGLASRAPHEPVFREEDVEAFRRLERLRGEARIPDEGLLEVIRVLGHGFWRTSEALRTVVAEAVGQGSGNEREIGASYVEAAARIRPVAEPFLVGALHAHLVEGVRSEIVTRAEIDSGRVDDTWEVGVCFVDLVGYTQLGERGPIEDVLGVAGRLAAAAAEVAHPPVRLIKTIGDAAMLVSADPEALLEAAGSLLAAIEADERLPPARVGLAYGTALTRGGDWFGRTVNLASRLTSAAAPGTVLATREIRDAAAGRWSPAGAKALKGIEGEVELFELDRV